MKTIQRVFCFMLIFVMITASVVVHAKDDETKEYKKTKKEEATMRAYEDYVSGLSVSNKDIVWKINGVITSEPIQTTISVPEDGVYTVALSYNSGTHNGSIIALEVKVDGTCISEGERSLWLDKIYCDIGGARKDGAGNEFAPEQGAFEQNVFIYPVDNQTLEQYEVTLTKGEHNLSVASLNDELYISEFVLQKKNENLQYTEPTNEENYYQGKTIIREGEDSLWKSSSWLVPLADNESWRVNPFNPITNTINYIGGSNWKQTGETITWFMEVPEDGYYQLGFSYRQNLAVNYSSYRKLLIDGQCPFEEVSAIEFPYSMSWEKQGLPYLLYLTEGCHTISLQVTLGDYYDICKRLENVIGELGELNLKMTMITGETVDISRDYDLFKSIPDLEERLTAAIEEMSNLEEEMIALSDGESSSYVLILRNMIQVANQMLNNKYSAARYKSDFYSNYSSLSQCLSEMQAMPLDIDQIILSAVGDETAFETEGGFSGFWKGLAFSVKRFFNTFFKDYNSVSGDMESTEKLTLWVNWGQDQARVLNSLIQTDFTTEYGIEVDVQVVNASIVQAILSGNGPDCVLQQARTEPVNLAMRGALYDLTQFDDYEMVLENFADGAETPYYYQDGLYALPDTQTFFVMFYRKDILDSLGLEVPTTWEEFDAVAKVLIHNNLSVYLPYTQITGTATVNTGVGSLSLYPTLLLQNGLDMYTEEQQGTTLTSPECLNVFQEWTEYYTKMNLPVTMNFYNRFRAGTCPLGIAPYSQSVTITAEAPELEGLWGMTTVPGTKTADGSYDHSIAGGGTGCSILNTSKNKQSAWKFLKWWTSTETQLAYTTNLESILGPLGRVMVSNTEALEALTWTEEEKSVILAALQDVKELPEIPGGYQVSRSIDMAFYDVTNTNANARDILTKWGKIADNEIERKLEQYKGGLTENSREE